MPTAIKGLYAITDPGLINDEQLLDAVALTIQGGVKVLQYRNKVASAALQREQAAALKALCQQHQVTFIINDDPELAAEVQADGVHVGKEDGSIANARAILGEEKIIGVSCYNLIEQAIAAQNAGANYVAFGRFFQSKTKPNAVQARPELLLEARKMLSVPIVAIGGITNDNASNVIRAGADSVAVINHLWCSESLTETARKLSELFENVG